MTDERDHPISPEQVDDRLAAWVDGELSGKDLERFEAELRVNKRLREQAESYRTFVSSMQGALQQPMGSVDVTGRVLAALQRPLAMAPRRSMVLPWLLSACVAAGLLTAVWIMQGPDAPCPPEVRDSATAPESSKLAATDNEKKALGDGFLESGAEMDKRKAAAGEGGGHFQKTASGVQPDPSSGKPGEEKERTVADQSVKVAKEQSERSDPKQEEAKNKSTDDFYLGTAKRDGELDKSRKAEAPAEGRPAGNPAPVTKAAEPVTPGRPQRGAAAADEKQDKDQPAKFARELESQSLPFGAAGWMGPPPVQVVVLTRRGTAEELRRNLAPRDGAENARARQTARGREQDLVEAQLAQQFPSLALGQTDSLQMQAARLQQTWAGNGVPLQLFSLGIPNVQAPSYGGLDQGRQSVGNRMPDGQQGGAREEALQRLLPEGTRANALYVEGEPARVQDFLKQVSAWAAYNDVGVGTDEMPTAEIENLKLSQLQKQVAQNNVSAQTGGGGGSKAAGPGTGAPAGPATPGPAGTVTGGQVPKSAPTLPPGQPEPLPAPSRAVLLLFREQQENKR